MKAYYCDHFVLPLPDNHRFPMQKYGLLRQRVQEAAVAELLVPEPATDEQILRAHNQDYLNKVENGLLTRKEIRRIGFPWSPQLVERSRHSVGGTINACRSALDDGVAVNLAGGTHHAGPDHGEGYCVFNDCAIAARAMQAERHIKRLAVIDCDVHQGNGTADIFQNDRSVYTFSIHGERNFPFRKITGDLDIGLPDETNDEVYLDTLDIAVDRIIALIQPELVIYISGADPFVGDTLGKLSLSKQGLIERDQLVLGKCHEADIPVAVTMGGGYAKQVNDIVDIHLATVKTAAQFAARYK